jgi:OmcA/MtrC family decaheme c-type cytochrome
VDIGMMSHRIHTGSELPSVQAGGSIIYGAQRTGDTPSNSDFSKFAMPPSNSTYRCLTCHEAGTWGLPAEGRLPVKRSVMACNEAADADANTDCSGAARVVSSDLRVPRATAMCTSCHDGSSAVAHAKLNTVDDDATLWNGSPGEVETCATCHGPGREWDALRIHPGETP